MCSNLIVGTLVCCFTVCIIGIQATDERIIGGRVAGDHEFPYQVELRYSDNDKHFCGGSVIGSRHILTAGHCMFNISGDDLSPTAIKIVAGQNKLTINSESIIRTSSGYYLHEEFGKTNLANDIAIVVFEEPLPLDTREVAIAIAALRKDQIATGTKCIITGWGVQQFGNETYSEDLLATEVSVVDFSRCRDMYGKVNATLSDGMMCANDPNGAKDACQGDSGGPLFCEGFLTGIVSTAIGCADPNFPGIYTDISQYIPWIQGIVDI